MGVFEIRKHFPTGTRKLSPPACRGSPATSVVGGGDSLAADQPARPGDKIDHLSTGGGASLEYVQGVTLPGVAALER